MHDSFAAADARAIWEASPDALLLVDQDGIIREANAEAGRMFASGDLVGSSIDTLVPSAGENDHARLRKGFHANPRRRAMGTGGRLQALRADGTALPVHVSLSPLDDEFVIAAVRDVSEVVAFEDRLVDSARRRILAEDHERIAKNMHDTIIQELFAVGMNLQGAVSDIADPEQAARINGAVATLDDVIASIRALIFDIRTNADAREDLRVRIVEIATSLIPSLGFEPSVAFHGPVDTIPAELHDDVLAVARESLTNVARHADATAAAIEVAIADGRAQVRVTDDGVGMPAEPVRQSGHTNLADRARALRGSFAIRADPEGGTTLEWSAPV